MPEPVFCRVCFWAAKDLYHPAYNIGHLIFMSDERSFPDGRGADPLTEFCEALDRPLEGISNLLYLAQHSTADRPLCEHYLREATERPESLQTEAGCCILKRTEETVLEQRRLRKCLAIQLKICSAEEWNLKECAQYLVYSFGAGAWNSKAGSIVLPAEMKTRSRKCPLRWLKVRNNAL
jgi:hypothetical protein